MLEVNLADLKRAAGVADGTVNDGFMAAVAGGFRLYHERHGVVRGAAGDSAHQHPDGRGPHGREPDHAHPLLRSPSPTPIRRRAITAMNRLCRAARRERSLPFTNTIAGALNLLPRGTVGSMLKHVDFVASDVPGFPFPVYLAGARLERYVAFGPTIGSSVESDVAVLQRHLLRRHHDRHGRRARRRRVRRLPT